MAYGPPQTVWTTQTPSDAGVQYPTSATIGCRIVCAVAGRITGLRYYRPPNQSAGITSRTLRLWDDAGTPAQIGTASTAGESGTGFKTATLAAPITVTAGQVVRVSIDNPDNASLGQIDPGVHPVINGDLTYSTSYRNTSGPPTTTRTQSSLIDCVFEKEVASPTVPTTGQTWPRQQTGTTPLTTGQTWPRGQGG